MIDSATALPKRSNRLTRWLMLLPLVSMFLLAIGWTGAWFFVARQSETVMDRWLDQEARRGRVWTCPERQINGYPFMIRVTCLEPRFTSTELGRASRGTLKRVTALVRLVDPRHLIAVFEGPFQFSPNEETTIDVVWAEARMSYRGTPGELSEASIEIVAPSATLRGGPGPGLTGTAKRMELQARRRPEGDVATIVLAKIEQLALPPLDRMINNAAPLDVELQSSFEKLAPQLAMRWQDRLEAWRQAGGSLRLVLLKANKGDTAIDLTGTLALDESRRLAGEINGRASGLVPVLQRLGLVPSGGILGQFLGQSPGEGRGLPIALRFRDGQAFFGPLPVARLRPLY